MITATRGDYIAPAYVIHLIGVVHNPGFIRRFQLVQESRTKYELKLVIEQGVLADQYDDVVGKIARDLIAVLGIDTKLDIVRVDDIPATASGKFLYMVNRLRGHSDPGLP